MLIKAHEVIKYSPAHSDYPEDYVIDLIENKEIYLFRTCIGKDIYDLLKADLNTYTYVNYVNGTTYNNTAIVLFNGTLYKSKINSNTDKPYGSTNWEVFKIFTTTCFNTAWESFLRPYLAYKIFADSLTYTTYKAGAKGVTKTGEAENGILGADPKTFQEYKNQLHRNADEFLQNFVEWKKETANSTCFKTTTTDCGCEANTNCNKKYNRIAFRV